MNEDFPESDQRAAVCEKQWAETHDSGNGQMSSQWLRAGVTASAIGVDRKNNILKGYVVALEGSFKSQGRGRFDLSSLKEIVRLSNQSSAGLKSRLQHATLSDDGVAKFLGRAKSLRMDKAVVERDGKQVSLNAIRGDLHFDSTALKEPVGGGKPIGEFVMDLAESDPAALSSSLVLQVEELFETDSKGKPKLGPNGEELPPLWIPKKVHGSDIVSEGDAVDSLLSPTELAQALSADPSLDLDRLLRFDRVQRLGTELLDRFFKKQGKEEIAARCQSWLQKYLEMRFPTEEPKPTPKLDSLRLRLEEQSLALRKITNK